MKIQPVILAGGNGHRLWPLSKKNNPKQFIKIFDEFSPFQSTIIRNAHLGIPLVIANIGHKTIISNQLKKINSQAKIIFEPEQKNTATCALVASYYAKSDGFDSIILIPSDHYIEDQINYNDALLMATEATKQHKFSVIGISPTCPNSNFGYIKTYRQIGADLFLASEFIEKPNNKLATRFANLPEYFWNSGIYFFDINYVLELANKFIPAISATLSQIFNNNFHPKNIVTLDQILYNDLISISFDDAISANLKHMAVIKAKFEWNDLGSWDAVWTLSNQDENHNSITGKVTIHNVHNSYISSDARNTAVIGLKNIVIVFEDGDLLVSHKNATASIKKIITKLD